MSEATDRAMKIADDVGGAVGRVMRDLVGCWWGTRIMAPGLDPEPCTSGADHRIILHRDEEDTVGTEVRLCDKHAVALGQITEPRTGEIA